MPTTASPALLRSTSSTASIRPGHLRSTDGRANVLSQAVQSDFEAILAQLRPRPQLRPDLPAKASRACSRTGYRKPQEMGSARATPAWRVVRRGLDIIAAFENLPYPTIAAVEGPCVGGGLGRSPGLRRCWPAPHREDGIGFPEVKIGLFPGAGRTATAHRRHRRRRRPVDLLGEHRTRWQLGLIFDAVPPEHLLDEAKASSNRAAQTGAARKHDASSSSRSDSLRISGSLPFAVAAVVDKTKANSPQRS